MATKDWVHELKSITLAVDGELSTIGPSGASRDYEVARQALEEAEVALRRHVLAVAAQRQALPLGREMPEYVFDEGPADLGDGDDPRPVALVDLFDGHDELIVYHVMFHPDDDQACPMCSSIVDGFRGIAHHMRQRCGFAIVAKAPVTKLREWGRVRGWDGVRLVSSFGNDFTIDMGTEGSAGAHVPAVSVFSRSGDVVHHRYTQSADFEDGSNGGVDQLWPIWHLVDLLPSGRTDWLPDNKYT